ncbi:MAG: hypothetical protein E7L01_25935 [Paenibacillus macerans]|uniref:hypothetical protein n=1 Tax=Paenibacillus macerans TaxID=44252 RepID=UPI0029097FA8|nr:hypothetical protein [Paenibacillus macerans]MDU7476754.1 hypothetical protein [Paenibacillus macerans]
MNAMNRDELRKLWQAEETKGFQGWDFSYLAGRMEEEELPWDYKANVQARVSGDTVMLDMGTGGGEFLLSLSPPADYNLSQTAGELKAAGFEVLERREYFPELRFKDVGAFVFFAKIIEWEFAGFSVDRCFERLLELHEAVERDGHVTSREHRFFILARKPFI